jgi:hypothetical protein
VIRFVVLEFVVLGLFWLFARNLWRTKITGKIMYSGSEFASRAKQPKAFWALVLFNILMLGLLAFCAVDVALS